MLARTERGCLILTDITGYTAYLTGSELDHAQDVLADLIRVVLSAVRPVLKLNKLEGDAAFLTAPQGAVDGPLLIDVIERCYFTFQRRLRDIRQATTCQCNACIRIPSLNLKFFAHDGEFDRLYDQAHHQSRLHRLFPKIDGQFCLPFRYPPWVAAAVAPLTKIPYAAAFAIFFGTSAAAWLITLRLLTKEIAPGGSGVRRSGPMVRSCGIGLLCPSPGIWRTDGRPRSGAMGGGSTLSR